MVGFILKKDKQINEHEPLKVWRTLTFEMPICNGLMGVVGNDSIQAKHHFVAIHCPPFNSAL